MASVLTWCRRHLAWSNSRRSWEERASTLGLLAGVLALWWFRERLALATMVALSGLLLVAAAVLLRRGWLRVFGPVLFYDMVRSARRGRYILMRCLYAGLLFFFLFVVYTSTGRFYSGGNVPLWVNAEIAQSFFETLMIVQLIAVVVLTPAYVAGSIADEKTRKTLEFLLATDLRSREIVLSKLCSRLANLGVFILTGLPILSFLQFLGGVDPNLVLAGYAVTGLTMLGLGGISILASTYCKRPRDAIAVSYLLVFAYFTVSFVLFACQFSWSTASASFSWGNVFADLFAGSLDWESLFLDLAHRCVDALNAGNIMLQYFRSAGSGGRFAQMLPDLLGQYALFQGVVAAVSVCWSIWRLRPVAVRQMSGSKVGRPWLFGVRFPRPNVGDLPMVWKELHIEGGLRLPLLVWPVVLIVMALTFLPGVFVIAQYWHHPDYNANTYGYMPGYNPLHAEMNAWARSMTSLVGSLTLLAVAVRSSTCISGERDRQTLDALLTTPMSASQLLAAKVLGNVASVRLAWLWLGGIWLLALLTGGLHPFALPLLLGAWLIYAFCMSVLGCWFSVISRTSTRAIVYTLLSAVGLAIGHWLPWMCCIPLMMYGGSDSGLEWLAKFQAGITPPAALAFLAFYNQDFRENNYGPDYIGQFIGFSVCGLFLWLCGGLFLWSVTLQRLRTLTLRGSETFLATYDQRYPHQRPPGRPVSTKTLPPRYLIDLDAKPDAEPLGATLIAEIQEPTQPHGAILIEEIQEKPTVPPPPPKDKDGK